ncbi:MAG: peroxide stress protein YaaA [Neisseriaceae bacterium]|nr:peroxide stress protein YaaA [Neisseriaceae bacterium]
MLYFILSPAKKLAALSNCPQMALETPALMTQAAQLVEKMRTFAPHELACLMGISDKLSLLNVERFAEWNNDLSHAAAAVYLFNGDAYDGLSVRTMPEKSITYLQNYLGILSGLYGLLKPLDGIYPHRLEMGTKLQPSLYAFWGDTITALLQKRMNAANATHLINLASNEYFSAVRPENLAQPVITPQFKQYKNGKYTTVSLYAKQARGKMVRFAAENNIQHADELKNFNDGGYKYCESLSDNQAWVFVR